MRAEEHGGPDPNQDDAHALEHPEVSEIVECAEVSFWADAVPDREAKPTDQNRDDPDRSQRLGHRPDPIHSSN